MRVIWLIAMREYSESVRTRGFWFGVLLVPLIFAGIFLFTGMLASSAPVRHFIAVDQSGVHGDTIASTIQREHQRRILTDFVAYLRAHLRNSPEQPVGSIYNAAGGDTEQQLAQFINQFDADELAALDLWLAEGGLDVALEMARPWLRENAPEFQPPRAPFVQLPLPAGIDSTAPASDIVEQLRPYLSGERRLLYNGDRVQLFALVIIPADVERDIIVGQIGQAVSAAPDRPRGVQFWASNLTDTRLSNALQFSINRHVREQALQERGISVAAVREVQTTRLPLSRLDPAKAAGEEAVDMVDTFRQWAPIGFVYLIFISLMQSVQYLLSNTIEEKSNRIIEVLIASVTPNELMMGKLIGIGLSGITTIAVWLLSFFAFIRLYQSVETAVIGQILDVLLSADIVPWFVFYYLAGYALYSGIFLAIGSLCHTLKEAQSLMVPLMAVLVVPLIAMSFIAQDPNGTLARVMSWIPLFTPFAMMNRAAAQPPMIDIIGTSVLLLLSVVLVLWLSGRVFRQGVLRSGQPPRLLELWQMLRQRG